MGETERQYTTLEREYRAQTVELRITEDNLRSTRADVSRSGGAVVAGSIQEVEAAEKARRDANARYTELERALNAVTIIMDGARLPEETRRQLRARVFTPSKWKFAPGTAEPNPGVTLQPQTALFHLILLQRPGGGGTAYDVLSEEQRRSLADSILTARGILIPMDAHLTTNRPVYNRMRELVVDILADPSFWRVTASPLGSVGRVLLYGDQSDFRDTTRYIQAVEDLAEAQTRILQAGRYERKYWRAVWHLQVAALVYMYSLLGGMVTVPYKATVWWIAKRLPQWMSVNSTHYYFKDVSPLGLNVLLHVVFGQTSELLAYKRAPMMPEDALTLVGQVWRYIREENYRNNTLPPGLASEYARLQGATDEETYRNSSHLLTGALAFGQFPELLRLNNTIAIAWAVLALERETRAGLIGPGEPKWLDINDRRAKVYTPALAYAWEYNSQVSRASLSSRVTTPLRAVRRPPFEEQETEGEEEEEEEEEDNEVIIRVAGQQAEETTSQLLDQMTSPGTPEDKKTEARKKLEEQARQRAEQLKKEQLEATLARIVALQAQAEVISARRQSGIPAETTTGSYTSPEKASENKQDTEETQALQRVRDNVATVQPRDLYLALADQLGRLQGRWDSFQEYVPQRPVVVSELVNNIERLMIDNPDLGPAWLVKNTKTPGPRGMPRFQRSPLAR